MNCRKILVAGTVILAIMISAATQGRAAEELKVQHSPLLCAARETPFELRFRVLSDARFEEARVYFRDQETEDFYFTLAQSQGAEEFLAILPGPQAHVSVLEYVLLLVDEAGTAVKSPIFALFVDEEQACEENRVKAMPKELLVSSDRKIDPEIGFSGDYIAWELPEMNDAETLYLDEAAAQVVVIDMLLAEPSEDADIEADIEEEELPDGSSSKRGMRKKILIGAGAAGALGLIGAVAFGGGGGGDAGIWGGLDDVTEQVVSVLYKTPAEQIACGAVVGNQLFVTNNASENVRLGTVDYEIILTKDSPSGSCQPGRSGSFAPSSKTILAPGENILIREWRNDVNPCSGCPYPSAECVWESRYIVHTSLGSSIAMSSFSARGDLCGGSSGKRHTLEGRQQLCGSDTP